MDQVSKSSLVALLSAFTRHSVEDGRFFWPERSSSSASFGVISAVSSSRGLPLALATVSSA
jgi:hypothetical protein